ncbi:TPA: hypothetical protein EYP45_03095 [Candidatus Peregrinibacteria bacterium]|nr:hypothetical protein [Candidatus Peregrinibacteria bacterium]
MIILIAHNLERYVDPYGDPNYTFTPDALIAIFSSVVIDSEILILFTELFFVSSVIFVKKVRISSC